MESSPLRSPLRYQQEETFLSPPESPITTPERSSPSKAIVPIGVARSCHGFSPVSSQREEKKQATQPESTPKSPVKSPSPVFVVNRSVREDLSVVKRVDPSAASVEEGGEGRSRAVPSEFWRSRREGILKRAALGFRVLEVVFCLISLSVMAADRTQGWSGDSFDRYKEYRYCVSVNVIAFVYSGLQAYDGAHHLITSKHFIRHPLRLYSDFSMDQILTYLLMSASSSAATRVDEWQSNWGKDEFTEMASASIGMSFLAFVAFALSSLISGYKLCSHISI